MYWNYYYGSSYWNSGSWGYNNWNNYCNLDAPIVKITEDKNNDGVLSKDEIDGKVDVTIKIGNNTQVGDTLEVTNPDGSKTTYCVTKSMIDYGLKLAFDTPKDGEKLEVAAKVYNCYGYSSSTASDNVVVDNPDIQPRVIEAPVVSIVEDSNNDGKLSQDEINGKVDVNITLKSGTQVGDQVIITNPDGSTTTYNVTSSMLKNGLDLAYDVPNNGESLKVSAYVLASSGEHSSSSSDIVTVTCPTVIVAPTVVITEDSNNNGVLTNNELNGNIDVLVQVSNGAKLGDSLIITNPDGSTSSYTVSNQILSNGLNLSYQALPKGETLSVKAQIVTTNGDKSAISKDSVLMDLSNSNIELSIKLDDDIGGDDLIDASEINQDIPITGKVFGNAQVGDIVTLKVNGNDFTGKVTSNGTFSIKVPASDLLADHDRVVDAYITVNGTTKSDSEAYNIKGAIVNTLPIEGDNLIDKNEEADVTISGKTIAVNAGETVTITLTDQNGDTVKTTTKVDSNGNWSATNIDVRNLADGDITVKTQTVDKVGNLVTDVDKVSHDGFDLGIKLDANIGGDDLIDSSDLGKDIPVKGTVTGDFNAGDIVNIEVNGKNFTGSVDSNGRFSIGVPASDLLADNTRTVEASITLNGVTAKDDETYNIKGSITTTLPIEGDNIIDYKEDDDVEIKGHTTTVAAGSTVAITITDANGKSVSDNVKVDANGNWNSSDIDVTSLIGGTLTVKAQTTDKAGNIVTDIDRVTYKPEIQGNTYCVDDVVSHCIYKVAWQNDVVDNELVFTDGNDKLCAEDIELYSKINTLDGNDTILVEQNIQGKICGNRTEVHTGAGDDTVNVGQKVSLGALLDTGSGDDNVSIGTRGNGEIKGVTTGGEVNLGSGNDTLDINGKIESNGKVYLGSGDDSVTLDCDLSFGAIATLDGGTGFDKLSFDNDECINLDLVSPHVKNMEMIDIEDGYCSTIKADVCDVLKMTDDNNTLMIKGDYGDKVDLDCYDTWAQTGTKTVDGHTYNVYTGKTYSSYEKAVLLVEDEIDVII